MTRKMTPARPKRSLYVHYGLIAAHSERVPLRRCLMIAAILIQASLVQRFFSCQIREQGELCLTVPAYPTTSFDRSPAIALPTGDCR